MPQLYGLPLLDGVFYLALLGFLIELDQGTLRSPKRLPQIYLLGGLWLAGIMSHVAHTYFVGMTNTAPDVFKFCFFTTLLITILDRPSRLRAVAAMFVFMSCTMAIHALLQQNRGYGFAWQRPLYVPQIGDRAPHTRSLFFGIFADPNDLAQILVTAIPFSFVLTRRKSFFSFLIGCTVTWLLISAILATHSRGGTVALAATGAVMLVLLLPSRWLPRLLLLMVLGGLALTLLSMPVLDQSAHDRVVFWGMANDVFKANPLFGIGYGMFWQVADDAAAHNAFVLAYTELGVFGYWFWFLLIQLGVVGAMKSRIALGDATDPDAVWLRMFCGLSLAAMTGFCAGAYFLSRSFVYPLFFLMAALGALTPIAEDYLPSDHPPIMDTRKDVYIMGTIGVLGSILYIYLSIVFLNRAFYG